MFSLILPLIHLLYSKKKNQMSPHGAYIPLCVVLGETKHTYMSVSGSSGQYEDK